MDVVNPNVTDNSTVQQVQHTTNRSQIHTIRTLVAYLDDQEKRNLLLGRPPFPGEDLAQLEQLIKQYNMARASRPNYTITNPIESEDNPILDTIRTRPDIVNVFGQLGLPYRPVMIDLKQVLAFQSFVRIDDLDERVISATKNTDSLLELCFPTSVRMECSIELNDQGYTFFSSNPNLVLAPTQIPATIAGGQTVPAQAFVPQVNFNLFSVAHYQERYFIRDGYHRAVGLLHNNPEPKVIVPCILVETQTLNQTGWKPGMIAETVMLSNKPPHLTDFWENTVSFESLRQPKRRVYRVRLDVFDVPTT